MDRQRIEGGLIRELAGEPIGSRHLEGEGTADQTEGRVRSGAGKAMDAVREVVNKEQARKDERRSRGGADRAMDAVREVVEKE